MTHLNDLEHSSFKRLAASASRGAVGSATDLFVLSASKSPAVVELHDHLVKLLHHYETVKPPKATPIAAVEHAAVEVKHPLHKAA